MASKQTSAPSSDGEKTLSAMTDLQEAGLGNALALGTAWIETLSDMGAEVLGFVAARIKEDVQAQHEILHCKNAADLHRIQSDFIQKAINQYQEETGKLVEMSTKAFEQKLKDSKS